MANRDSTARRMRAWFTRLNVTAGPVPDEHLVSGRGGQPCGELLSLLPPSGYPGAVVVEVKTNRAPTREDRMADLAESLAFARQHLAVAAGRTS